jgi:hypothetical protein
LIKSWMILPLRGIWVVCSCKGVFGHFSGIYIYRYIVDGLLGQSSLGWRSSGLVVRGIFVAEPLKLFWLKCAIDRRTTVIRPTHFKRNNP